MWFLFDICAHYRQSAVCYASRNLLLTPDIFRAEKNGNVVNWWHTRSPERKNSLLKAEQECGYLVSPHIWGRVYIKLTGSGPSVIRVILGPESHGYGEAKKSSPA